MSDEKKELKTQKAKPVKVRQTLSRRGMVMTTIAFILIVGAFTYGYFQLSKVNLSLARTVSDLKQQMTVSQQNLTAMQASLSGVQNGVQKAEVLTGQQEKMISSWIEAQQGDLSKWHVAEAAYLTKLASYQLELSRDGAMAFILLQHAQEILQKIQNPAIDNIRQSLAENVTSLQAQPQVNTEQLYLQMASIYNQLDNLPLPATPLQYTEDANAPVKNYGTAPWWKLQWHRTMDALRKIVIVRYTGANDMPLILPEEKMFLYQNLHAQMEAAMLSVLNHHPAVYQTSLAHLSTWIQKYFVQDAPATQAVLTQLQALQAVNLQPPAVNVAATLQMFDQYLAQNQQPQPAIVQ